MVVPICCCCNSIDTLSTSFQFNFHSDKVSYGRLGVLKYGTPYDNFQIGYSRPADVSFRYREYYTFPDSGSRFYPYGNYIFDKITSYYFKAEIELLIRLSVYDSNGRIFNDTGFITPEGYSIYSFAPGLFFPKAIDSCHTYKYLTYSFDLESPVYGDPYTILDSLGKKDIQKNLSEFSSYVCSVIRSKVESLVDLYSSFSYVYDLEPYRGIDFHSGVTFEEYIEGSALSPEHGFNNLRDVQGILFNKFSIYNSGYPDRFPSIKLIYNFKV
ncbi:hypothetical protein A9K75_08920 [Campylobacter fetus subsp. testudinum]|uniref:hypothetical protein n=1 Tax=Campylobacter fetus TaxID=196 RepID=UPI000818839B|nr:hypothetical protein [Campylobacter fetus]OCR98992.1 hypothetical protein A9K75_08920 [Campylobacter fetus subsp. testudinum]